jgi:23S rRNA (guanosine2251-2'-O)-methyltransferase
MSRGERKKEPRASVIFGLQPVREAIRAGKRIAVIHLARENSGTTQALKDEAQEKSIRIAVAQKSFLERLAGGRNHQGVVAEIRHEDRPDFTDVETILEYATSLGEAPLIVLLDEIQDPRNLGAILRSAHALGAHGVVLPKNRSAPVSAVAVKASAGAAQLVPIAEVTNLKHAMRTLRDAGVWIAAATMEGQPPEGLDLTVPTAFVLGSEGEGIKKTIIEQCDHQVSVPLSRGFDSLNVSVATGVLLYEAGRQRRSS